MLMIISSILIWLLCGFIAAGFAVAYLQRAFPALAEFDKEEDYRTGLIFMLLGPGALISTLVGFCIWKDKFYGWVWPILRKNRQVKTIEDLLKHIPRTTKFRISKLGYIRCKGRCPIEVAAKVRAGKHVSGANKLGMSDALRANVVTASDSSLERLRNRHKEAFYIREKILAHFGLKEDFSA